MTLADILKKAYDTNLVISDMTKASLQQIQDIATEFNLVPDNMIDIKRLPVEVVDLKTLKTWMLKIREELAKLDEKDRSKSELVTGGLLKLYRTVILCIHCLNNFVSDGGLKENMPFKSFRDAIFKHGAANPPAEMSENGKKAWEASIVQRTVRVKNVMGAIIILASPKTEILVDGSESKMVIVDGDLAVSNGNLYVDVDDVVLDKSVKSENNSDDEQDDGKSDKKKTGESGPGDNVDNFQDTSDNLEAGNDELDIQEEEASVDA